MNIDQTNLAFRKEMASDLLVFKKSLEALNINAGIVDRAIRELKDEQYLPGCVKFPSSPRTWGYKINPLIINVDDYEGVQYPQAKNMRRLKVSLSVNVVGEYSAPDAGVFLDPYGHLEFNLFAEGFNRQNKHHILSFHLDRHIDAENKAEEVHPIYHFHVGGRIMEQFPNRNFGSSLILDSPRWMHYPMDLMLGVDFALSNFAPKLWKKAKKDQGYVRLIRKSQQMAILPFIKSLSQYFQLINGTPNCWQAIDILPQLVR